MTCSRIVVSVASQPTTNAMSECPMSRRAVAMSVASRSTTAAPQPMHKAWSPVGTLSKSVARVVISTLCLSLPFELFQDGLLQPMFRRVVKRAPEI